MVDTVVADDFFAQTDYKGAFGQTNWLDGWSYLSGSFVGASSAPEQLCGALSGDVVMHADVDYTLTCQTFVTSGSTLTIEAGTTVKSLEDDGAGLAPALVIEQGAKIFANGTAAAPITFTSILDPADMLDLRGNWGGLIINGYAPISTTGGVNFVEGLEGVPYGGTDPADNSGVLSYVRVWHGGRSIGQDNEINGITLAGVGSGTTVENCEVAWNLDDGFEMFGGTVDLKYCSVVNVGDDSFDTDEGYQGRGQFLFVHRDGESDRCMEMDNKTNDNLDSQPRSHPVFSNMTCMGGGADSDMAKLREGTGGDHRNLIMVDGAGDGIENEDNGSELVTQDLAATAGLYPDYLYISSNTLMHNVANPWKDTTADLGFTNASGDPGIGSTADGVDVTPSNNGPAYELIDDVASDWFTQTSFKGAFGQTNWLDGWSYLSGSFFESDGCTSSGDVNFDNNTDVLDIVAIVSAILGINSFDDDEFCEGDVNADGSLDVLDVVAIVSSVLEGRGIEATKATFIKTDSGMSMSSNGVVGAVQITLSHNDDFSIELTQDALVAEYNTDANSTTLIVVAPIQEIFVANGDYNIDEVIAATSEGYIATNIVTPDAIGLSNAYPNPFNPSTSFDITVGVAGNVSVMVYNVNGQVVDIIHDGSMDAGVYNMNWNASNLSSGMYFIKANNAGMNVSQKIMLIK